MANKNVVILLGVETIRKNGLVVKYSQTFLNNAKTWKRDNPKHNLVIIDALKYIKNKNPLEDIWKDICSSFPQIDQFMYFGHSSDESLIVLSHTRTELPIEERYYRSNFHYDAPWAPDAEIFLCGCHAGGREGKKWSTCIAQTIANKTGRTVWAYVSRSYQIENPRGRFYQKSDDKIGLVKFGKIDAVIDVDPTTNPSSSNSDKK